VRWLTVQAALQADAEVPLASDAKPAAGLGPRLTLQARAQSGLVFTVSGARTTRFPSMRERFSEGMGFREPNPSLGPESAWTATAEGRWTPSAFLELLLFGSHSEVSGLINTVTLSTGLTQLQNLERAQLSSVEGKVSVKPHPTVRLEAGLQGLRAVQLTSTGPVSLEYRAPVQGVRARISQPEGASAPGQTAAHGLEEDQLSGPDPAVGNALRQGQGNGSRRGVGVLGHR
jgi:outer membrane receptor protein involved in Fe transport